MEIKTKYNIGDELWAANYEICQDDNGKYVLSEWVKRVHIDRIEIQESGSSIFYLYFTSDMKCLKNDSDLAGFDLFRSEVEAKKAAKKKVIMAAKLEISNYESIIKEKQKRIEELKQEIIDIEFNY